MLLDLRLFKLARIVVKDLPVAIDRMNKSIKLLEPYQRYRAVGECLYVLHEQKQGLEMELAAYTKLLKNRGKIA